MNRGPYNNGKIDVLFNRGTPLSSQSPFSSVLRFRDNTGAFLFAGEGKLESDDIRGINSVPVNNLFSDDFGVTVLIYFPGIEPIRRRTAAVGWLRRAPAAFRQRASDRARRSRSVRSSG